jgi:hypothetical protein
MRFQFRDARVGLHVFVLMRLQFHDARVGFHIDACIRENSHLRDTCGLISL